MVGANGLMDDFDQIKDKEWQEKVITDLKGKDFKKILVWEDENGIEHQPYYRSSNLKTNLALNEIQNAQKQKADWKIIQIFSSKNKKLKSLVNDALNNGVDDVVIENVSDSKKIRERLGESLKDSPKIHLHLTDLANNNLPKTYFSDPIGEMVEKGSLNEQDFSTLKGIFQKRLNQLKPDNFLLVDGSIYKNAGSTTIQEIAFTLHHAVEYLDILTDAGYTAEAVARSFTFRLGFGTSYFTEIAKARAFRYLLKKIFTAYKVNAKTRIWGIASQYFHSHKDPHTNLLRLSSQCMSAVLGNCDLVSLPSYDEWEEASLLGYRMSKNIPLILKNESFFDKIRDIPSGSFYLESLTLEIVEKSWDLFSSINNKGGLLVQVKNGQLKKDIDAARSNRKSTFKNEDKAIIGVNKFINNDASELKSSIKESGGISKSILSKEIS